MEIRDIIYPEPLGAPAASGTHRLWLWFGLGFARACLVFAERRQLSWQGGLTPAKAMFRQALHCRQPAWISENSLGALISTYWPQEAIGWAESG